MTRMEGEAIDRGFREQLAHLCIQEVSHAQEHEEKLLERRRTLDRYKGISHLEYSIIKHGGLVLYSII